MKTLLILAMALAALPAGAQSIGNNLGVYVGPPRGAAKAAKAPRVVGTNWAAHPFREVGGRYCDVRALYAYLNGAEDANRMTAWSVFYQAEVLSVAGSNTLFRPYANSAEVICVTNFPAGAVDGQRVPFVAMPAPGTFQYRAVDGSARTVKRYDYGVPVAAEVVRK